MSACFPAKDRSLIRAGLICFAIAAALLWIVASCAGATIVLSLPAPPVNTNPPAPYHTTLLWDEPDTNATSFSVAWGTNGLAQAFTNTTTTTSLTVSGLWQNTSYLFSITSVDGFGITGASASFVWPWQWTNYAPLLTMTGTQLTSMKTLVSSQLVVADQPLLFFRQVMPTQWNNVLPFEHPDR